MVGRVGAVDRVVEVDRISDVGAIVVVTHVEPCSTRRHDNARSLSVNANLTVGHSDSMIE